MTPDYLQIFRLNRGWSWARTTQKGEMTDNCDDVFWPTRKQALDDALANHPERELILQLEAQ